MIGSGMTQNDIRESDSIPDISDRKVVQNFNALVF